MLTMVFMVPIKRNTANPVAVFFHVLPYGISGGFASVTLPFLLTNNGFSVSAAASITALGLSSNVWRFLWAPMTDLTLSLHKWYLIGIGLCTSTLLLLGLIPLETGAVGILTITVFLSQIAATLIVSPVGGFMAKTIPEYEKGRAGGWIADKYGRWLLFFGAGALMATVTLIMSLSAYLPTTYIIGVLFYALTFGLANAGFSAIVLHAIGKGLASTKYALLSSFGNIPYAYMTYIDGRLHDSYNLKTMLLGETLLGISFIIISLLVLYQLRLKKLVLNQGA